MKDGRASRVPGFHALSIDERQDVIARIADLKCEDVESAGADALVLGDLGCMLNIEGRLRRRGDARTKVLHVAEVLAGMTDPVRDMDRRTPE